MITFRDAKKRDFEAFNRLWTNIQYLGGATDIRNEPMKLEEFEKNVEDESIILAEVNENIIGYAIVRAYDDGEVVIKEVFIRDDNKHQGYGRKLVEYIENLAKELGISKIKLDSATMETDRFWEHLGYSSILSTDEYCKILL